MKRITANSKEEAVNFILQNAADYFFQMVSTDDETYYIQANYMTSAKGHIASTILHDLNYFIPLEN